MDIQTVNKEKMEALKSLAQTNIQVSEAKEALASIKTEESKYFEEREKKALARIEVILKESSKILEDAYKNYNDIHNLSKSSSESALFLTEAHTEFLKLQEVFEKKTKAWEENIEIQEKRLEEIKRSIKVDKIQIKNDQDTIIARNAEIRDGFRLLTDRRELLEKGFKELKELTNK